MKFSVLLPTKDRLEYLKFTIESVLKQDYDDWELVISDNASRENIGEYITSLNEPRIKYSRSKEALTITESWNRSLELSSGEYVIMLGDDDILLKNYFQLAEKLLNRFHQPDLIYTNAFLYAYPNTLPGRPQGVFVSFGSTDAMPKHEEPYLLAQSTKLALVQQMMNFHATFGSNMQHGLIHRPLIEKIKKQGNGKFFHSPYPDIYAMCALFMESTRTIVYPKEMVVIGITPKSHGYYLFNSREKEALTFLKAHEELAAIPSIESILIPASTSMLSFWLGAIELLKINFPLEQYKLKLDYNLYRKMQTTRIISNFLNDQAMYGFEFKELMRRLTLVEKATFVLPRMIPHFIRSLIPKTIKKKIKTVLKYFKPVQQPEAPSTLANPFIKPPENSNEHHFSNASEIFEKIEADDCIK